MRHIDATGLATALMGDAVFARFIVVGVALQAGWLPVGAAALQRAAALWTALHQEWSAASTPAASFAAASTPATPVARVA